MKQKSRSVCHADLLLLIYFWIVRSSQQKVHRDVVEISNFTKCGGGNVYIASFIVAVHALATGKDLSHFCLRQILVLSQVPDSAVIRHNHTTFFLM